MGEVTSTPPVEGEEDLVCFCRQVRYDDVRDALRGRTVRTLADIQRETGACTRCFGCRFELERVRREELGDFFEPTGHVTLPELEGPTGTQARRRPGLLGRLRPKLPPKYVLESPVQRMYTPVLLGFDGSDVTTRLIFFHWPEDESPEATAPVDVRVDLMALDGTRVDVWRRRVEPRRTEVLDVAALAAGRLPGAAGVLKTVIQSDRVASLRPYFHLETPGGITTTHEKAAGRKPSRSRPYHWTFQITPSGERAYFFLTNTQLSPIEDNRLVWQGDDGSEVAIPIGRLELDQSACVALHEHVPAIREGSVAGTVRLDPSVHVAGFQLRHDQEADLWRVQHL